MDTVQTHRDEALRSEQGQQLLLGHPVFHWLIRRRDGLPLFPYFTPRRRKDEMAVRLE